VTLDGVEAGQLDSKNHPAPISAEPILTPSQTAAIKLREVQSSLDKNPNYVESILTYVQEQQMSPEQFDAEQWHTVYAKLNGNGPGKQEEDGEDEFPCYLRRSGMRLEP
jgi:hypothetical protein